jgi:hypothetical protein
MRCRTQAVGLGCGSSPLRGSFSGVPQLGGSERSKQDARTYFLGPRFVRHALPKGWLRDALIAQREIQARVFEALKRIKPSELVSEGRVYGGGLHKVEPKELAQIPARVVLESIDAQIRIEQQERLFV